MDVSIIIINYNTLELTKNTINSVIEKTQGIKYEIILVDNASADGSIEYFEEKYRNKIIFLKNRENLGFGRANNKGIEIAKGKYVFLLNSDTLLINNAIKILFEYMELNPKVGVCGGNLYDGELNPTHSYLKKIPSIKTEINYFFNILGKIVKKISKKRDDFNYSESAREVGYITGADMMIRKSILEKIGIFDEIFFMYSEEAELTYRIKQAGYKIISIPKAKIVHLEGKSTKFKEKKFKMCLESKYKYFYKIYGIKSCKNFYLISQLGYFLRLFFSLDKDYWVMIKINKQEYKNFIRKFYEIKKGSRV